MRRAPPIPTVKNYTSISTRNLVPPNKRNQNEMTNNTRMRFRRVRPRQYGATPPNRRNTNSPLRLERVNHDPTRNNKLIFHQTNHIRVHRRNIPRDRLINLINNNITNDTSIRPRDINNGYNSNIRLNTTPTRRTLRASTRHRHATRYSTPSDRLTTKWGTTMRGGEPFL